MEEYQKYIIVAFLILALDGLWIYSNFRLYSRSIKAVQNSELSLDYYATIAAYVVIIFTSLYITIPFTKHYIVKSDSVAQKLYKAFIYGGAVGFAIHFIYNLTSKAIYKNYEWSMVLTDGLWGTFLYTTVIFIYLMLP